MEFAYKICTGLRTTLLPNSQSLILAAGFSDGKIQLFSSESETLGFGKSEVLSGHENWVHGLDFTNDGE